MFNLISLKLKQDRELTKSFPSSQVHSPPLLQNVPKLKSLHMTRVPIYPILFGIKSLVDLKLVDYKLPFQKFVGFLESNLNLEVVELSIEFSRIPALITRERGVINVEVHQVDRNSCALASFLPYPSTHIQDLLAPITTIKYLPSPGRLHLSGKNGSLSFHSRKSSQKPDEELDLFATGTVCEFHLPVKYRDRLSWALGQLLALEALVISQGYPSPKFLSVLAKEPVLCPLLKTVAFLDCDMNYEAVFGLEEILVKREHSTAARLHQVVIVSSMRNLPNHHLISKLLSFIPRVCVCVFLLYSHQLGGQRSPLSTTSGGNFVPSTQLTIIKTSNEVPGGEEKKGEGKSVEGVPCKEGRDKAGIGLKGERTHKRSSGGDLMLV